MTATLVAVPASATLAYRDLISEHLWQRMVARIAREEDLDVSSAQRIVNEALGFVKCIADHPGTGLAPSPLVDIGWHTFILYTREYAAFCARHAGVFIHHDPTDDPTAATDVLPPADTVEFMVRLGYPVDPSMWVSADTNPGDCSCSADGGGGIPSF
jgi:hypothetical protein